MMSIVFSSITFFWILIILALICYKYNHKKKAVIFLSILLIGLFVCTVTPLPIFLARHLEQTYPNSCISKKQISILILGAGHTDDSNLSDLNKLSEIALTRLVQGVTLYKQFPDRKLVCSGYSISNQTPVGVVMARTAVELGVNPKDTLILTKPSSTWEEAIIYKKRFGIQKEFFLVTSAIHMPRAMETFKRQGLHPIPVPTNYIVKSDSSKNIYTWKPSWSKIQIAEKAFHEYFGILYYRYFKTV